MKIKILEIYSDKEYYHEDIIRGVTDWEEATDAQFKKLTKWARSKSNRDFQYIIARQSDWNIQSSLADFEKLIEAEAIEIKNKAAAAAKAARTRLANAKLKREAKEKEEFERLQKKFGNI